MKVRAHVPDFIKENRSAVSHGEAPVAVIDGVCKSALHMSEELGFEQFLRDGPAIDGDEHAFGAATVVVQGPCDEFLPGSALTRDEDGALRVCDFLDDR